MSRRKVLAIPGRIGGTFTHIMAFSWAAAERRGAEVHHVVWPPDPPVNEAGPWVVEQVAPRLAELDRPLLIAKSLGEMATAVERFLDEVIWR